MRVMIQAQNYKYKLKDIVEQRRMEVEWEYKYGINYVDSKNSSTKQHVHYWFLAAFSAVNFNGMFLTRKYNKR